MRKQSRWESVARTLAFAAVQEAAGFQSREKREKTVDSIAGLLSHYDSSLFDDERKQLTSALLDAVTSLEQCRRTPGLRSDVIVRLAELRAERDRAAESVPA